MTYKLFPALLLAAGLVASPALAQDAKPGKVKVKRKAKTETPVTPAMEAAPAGTGRQAPIITDWNTQYAGTINMNDLRMHLSVLASDKFEGRETGEIGQKMAAEYIAQQFKAMGLVGPVKDSDNPYLQHFTMERSTWTGTGTLKVGTQSYQWMKDFYGYGSSPFQTATTLQPVFAGYGIEQEGYSDYAALGDVKGKDLIVLLGEPNQDGKALLGKEGQPSKWGMDFRAKSALATQKGARSVFFVYADAKDSFSKSAARMAPYLSRPSIRFMDAKKDAKAATFFVSQAAGAKLLGTTEAGLTAYMASVNKANKALPSKFKPAKLTLNAPKKVEPFTTENVLGFLEGTDKKDEIMVVSAHYDHIGIIGGQVHNGADDDGSGTVSVLEMAQAFTQAKAEGHGPRRSILFLTVTGEEKGLLGSEYYTDHPVFPLEQTIVDLNIDMVGRTDKDHEGKADYVYVIGSDKLSSELYQIVETANKQYIQMDLDYRFNDPGDPNRFYYRSDHYNFAKHKIPVAFFFNGVHDDYHGAGDEIEKIEFPKMEKRARLVFYSAWELANRDNRIVVDSNKP
ncbi:M28 family peptidase [Hymenobacter busanensis]|uniref:M28 family peptidase n=1 Tax=Hymenobacter busanensis TaxID=2607656 RepID=A0A7L4ZYT3_9BACT|nr:M28 family peptidase [Hymenobacter busanensis]KAA9331494.1 M28 family peptidase [Hymenobacter busanensis]QHJ08649.1 M28 family peptidase [Hymenobacter busanensis]